VAIRAIGFILDVTESLHDERALRDANRFLEEERDHFERQSHEDPLTRIANRRALDLELARVCARAGRSSEVVVVGMIDIDYFKRFNDRYGHLHGDEILCRVAWALKAASRTSDFVARYGGEEFAFILEAAQSPEVAVECLFDAIARLDIPHDDSPHGRITASCGAVVADGTAGWDADGLLRSADAMLYIAKATGRNRYVVTPAEAPSANVGVPVAPGRAGADAGAGSGKTSP
jgi:diguanylate cyclase (GGDEF)-like protein